MTTYTSNVFIYGATFPGLIAARKLAAMGKVVRVCEWTNHVGGLTTGGLGKGDIVGQVGSTKNTRWGLTLSFFKAIGANAPYNLTDTEQVNFAPSEAITVMNSMLLDHANVLVATNCRLKSVTKDPLTRKITSVTMENGDIYNSTIFMDCSYEADLAAMAGVTMSYGRDSQRHYNERIQDREGEGIQQPGLNLVGLDEEDFKSVDTSGNLYPWRTWPPSPWLLDGSASTRSQAYGWRFMFSNNAANRLAWPMPDGYRREDFLWVADMINNGGGAGGTYPLRISGYEVSGEGSGKYTTNGGDLPGFLTNGWTKASYAERIRMQEEAFYFASGIMYFAANDASVPSNYRTNLNNWGLCADEFQTDYIGAPGWPSAYYVRQSRAMVGQYVMTTADMFDDGSETTNWHKSDPIAVGGYTIDAHPYYWFPDPDGARTWEEGKLAYSGLKLYSISLKSILPAVSQVSNLIVPVGYSGSTLHINSARMEPTWGVICESAATLAGIALDQGKSINDVAYADLRTALDAAGAVLAL